MDNHQSELADELETRGHITVTRNCVLEWTTEDGANAFWETVGMRPQHVPFFGGRNKTDDGDEGRGNCVNEYYVSSLEQIIDRVMGTAEKTTNNNGVE